MSEDIIMLSDLKVGQRFYWVPKPWYGLSRLISKEARFHGDRTVYDVRFDAAVVNPPGVAYGVAANTKVRVVDNA